MSEKDDKLQKLCKMLENLLSDDNGVEAIALEIVNKGVDADLLKALGKVCNGHPQGKVYSTLAYLLAHELYSSTPSESAFCSVSALYREFIHRAGHALWSEYGSPHTKAPGTPTH